MKNKWKIAFWICLLLLIVTGLAGFYAVVDQAVTLTYMREGYTDTEADLETLIKIVETTDVTKSEVEAVLNDHRLREYMDFNSDTVALESVILIFENDTLTAIER